MKVTNGEINKHTRFGVNCEQNDQVDYQNN